MNVTTPLNYEYFDGKVKKKRENGQFGGVCLRGATVSEGQI
jgi:hypothetical protein